MYFVFVECTHKHTRIQFQFHRRTVPDLCILFSIHNTYFLFSFGILCAPSVRVCNVNELKNALFVVSFNSADDLCCACVNCI